MPPSLPWKSRLSLSVFSAAVSASCRKNLTVNRRLWSFFDIKIPPSEIPKNGVRTSDFMVDTSRNLWFRLYTPVDNQPSMPIVVFLHGGGFSFFTADSIACELGCERLACEQQVIVVSISYRLAPEHKCPSQYEDCFDTLTFIDTHWDYLPSFADPDRCFLLGDSAGGNIIHHMVLKTRDYQFERIKIIGLVMIQPFFGGEERTESETRIIKAPVLSLKLTDWFWKVFLPDGSDRDHPAANVLGPNASDISGVWFPPMLLFVGGLDILQDRHRSYCEELERHGFEVHLVEYPNAIHGFWGLPDLPEYASFVEDLRDFIQKH